MEFDPVADMNAIEGVIADLAARTNRPQGYPFSKVTVYSVCPEIALFMPHFNHVSAAEVPSMRKLDFKKAGKVFGAKVQDMKNNLADVPEEFIITASRFDAVDQPKRKTTGCRKYLVEVETEDCPERWEAILFRKATKKYVTEDLGLNIVPPIFAGDCSWEEYKAHGMKEPDRPPVVPRVVVTLGDCSERLYQALEEFGQEEFADLPIRLRVPSRAFIVEHLEYLAAHRLDYGDGVVNFRIDLMGNDEFRITHIGNKELSDEAMMRISSGEASPEAYGMVRVDATYTPKPGDSDVFDLPINPSAAPYRGH